MANPKLADLRKRTHTLIDQLFDVVGEIESSVRSHEPDYIPDWDGDGWKESKSAWSQDDWPHASRRGCPRSGHGNRRFFDDEMAKRDRLVGLSADAQKQDAPDCG